MGVRIEDLVLFDAAAGRVERLTRFPREVIALRADTTIAPTGSAGTACRRSSATIGPRSINRPRRSARPPIERPAGANAQEPRPHDQHRRTQEGRGHRARRRALADPRLPPHQDGPRQRPGPHHAAQHQARPDGRALVPGRHEVAARVDGEASRPVPLPRRRRLPLHGQRHLRPVHPDRPTSSARRPST